MRGHSIGMGSLGVLLALSVGCMSDSESVQGDGGGGTDTSVPESPTGSNGEDNADTTGSADPSGESTGGNSDEDTGSSGSGPCDGLDCGENGSCEANADDQPTCVCDQGYVAYGLRCLPCTQSDGLLDVDIPTATVSATFELRGEPFPSSLYQHGDIVLRDPQNGDEVVLGSTLDGEAHDVKVIPGSYEIHYVKRAGGLEVPANGSARIGAITIAEGGAPSLVIDVPAVDLHGAITMNDMPPPDGLYENGEIVLRNPSTGDEVVLGETYEGQYRAMVIPGIYDVHYRRKLADAQAPHNRDVRFASLEVHEFATDQESPIDVPVTNLSGTFFVDGADPPPGVYDSGRIALRDLETHDEIVLGSTHEGTYGIPVVTGTYEVVYHRLLGGELVPANAAAVLETIDLAAVSDTHDVSIQTAVVTGTITVDNAGPPSSPADDGLILLRNTQTGDEAVLGNTADGTFTRRVVPGTYDVYYRQETSSGGVPVNTNAKLDSVDIIMGGGVFDVDVPMVSVSASVTVGGAAPPDSVYDDGLLYLIDSETGDTVLLGNTRLASLERPVVPGSYDLVYVVEAAGPTMPVNSKSVLTSVDIAASTNLPVNLPAIAFGGAITLEGGMTPQGFYDQASLFLHDLATDDTIDLGTIDVGAFARTINAGTYVLAYHMLATTGTAPANANAGLACVELTGL